jgi:hypothetical protein
MYFPYLRGKRFELIGLRELIEKDLIGNKVIPIIEPISPSPTMAKTLKCYVENNKKIAIIINPSVGGFIKEFKKLKKKETDENKKCVTSTIIKHINNENAIKSYLMDKNMAIKIANKPTKNDFLIINTNRDCLEPYLSAYKKSKPVYILIPDNDRAFLKSVQGSKISFRDYFNKQNRNSDYSNCPDEFFTDIHLCYEEDGYDGFSDYSIVGEEYEDSGFAPKAVAIHIVYFDKKNALRIRHFVSDSNENIKDTAGKFGEALEKLVRWCKSNKITETEGLRGFYGCYKAGKYPGLGTVKKLSIMHHIELMNKFLEGNVK